LPVGSGDVPPGNDAVQLNMALDGATDGATLPIDGFTV
jgi:hypothetical protein